MVSIDKKSTAEQVRQILYAKHAAHVIDIGKEHEKYDGIRPAPGYPAQPDHLEKKTLFSLLGVAEKTGIDLTENLAMTPAASVSGIYFAHPEASYFSIGKIEKDQVEDYAHRKGLSLAEAEKWLAPILNYK